MKFFINSIFLLINILMPCFIDSYQHYDLQFQQSYQPLYYNNYLYNNDMLSQPVPNQFQSSFVPQINNPYTMINSPKIQHPAQMSLSNLAIPKKELNSQFFVPKSQRAQTGSKRIFKFEESEPEVTTQIIKKEIKECGILKPLLAKYVANGQTTPHTKWPWHSQIIIDGNDSEESETYCGGTLVSKNFVLTAAHCYDDLLTTKRAKNTQILLNGISLPNTLRRKNKSNALKFRAVNVFIHPDYVPAMSDREAESRNQLPGPRNDLALVEINVNDPVIRDLLMPVCLPASGYQLKTGTKCKIMGHGFMTDKDEVNFIMPNELQMADVLISSNSACRNEVDSDSIKAKINADTVCIRGPIHPCVGDSGGPLLCQGTAKTQINGDLSDDEYDQDENVLVKKWFLTGVTSFAVSTDEDDKCGQFKSAVFGKVAHNIDWINRITGINN